MCQEIKDHFGCLHPCGFLVLNFHKSYREHLQSRGQSMTVRNADVHDNPFNGQRKKMDLRLYPSSLTKTIPDKQQ